MAVPVEQDRHAPEPAPGPPDPHQAELGPRVLAAVGYATFSILAIDHLGDGPLRALDEPVLAALPHTGAIFQVSQVVTHLGDQVTLTALALLGIALLLTRRDHVAAGVLALAKAVSVVVVFGLKVLVGRTRPPLEFGTGEAVCCAFPSGHATESAMVLMLLAVLLFGGRQRLRPWAEGVAIGLALVVGVTRLLLGVHWPTDVVAGWGLGWGLAGSFLLLRGFLERKKALPHVAPGDEVGHAVGLNPAQRVDVHQQARVPVTVEDVTQRGPPPLPSDPLHAQELGPGVQGLVAREHG